MINADERHLLQQAGFTERQINTQMQKFYNLFRVAPMPQMKKEWVGLTDEDRWELVQQTPSCEETIAAVSAKLKEKNAKT